MSKNSDVLNMINFTPEQIKGGEEKDSDWTFSTPYKGTISYLSQVADKIKIDFK